MERENLADITNEPTWREKLNRKDPDLKCPKHDAMSFALSDLTFCANLLASAGVHVKQTTAGELEFPVEKGRGQYLTIVGFADRYIEALVFEGHGPAARRFYMVEAKPELTNPMETMRQIKTYLVHAPYRNLTRGLLWCPTISPQAKKIFQGEGIFVCSETIEALTPPA